MANKSSGGCLGAVALLVVVSMVISFLVFLLGVAAVVAGLGAAGWLGWSAARDLRLRHRLGQGTEPLQATAERARAGAEACHRAASEALGAALEDWRTLRVTRAIGTPLQESFDRLDLALAGDVVFQDLLLRAEIAHARSVLSPPATARELAEATVELDRLHENLRRSLHRHGPR